MHSQMLILALLFAWVYSKLHYLVPVNILIPYLLCSRGRLAPVWALVMGVLVDGINPFRIWLSPISYLGIYLLHRLLERVRGMDFLKALVITLAYGLYEWGVFLSGVQDSPELIYIRILLTGALSFLALRYCAQERT